MNTRVVCGLLLLCSYANVAGAEAVSATLAWGRTTALGLAVSGVVAAVPVATGDRVTPGQELVRLDQREFETAVVRAQAKLASARVQLDEARREDERAVELYDRTVLSDHERQKARIALRAAEAALEVARAELSAARLARERSVLRAPAAGLVVAVDVAPGEVIVSRIESKVLVRMVDTQIMRARAPIDRDTPVAVDLGADVQVRVGARVVPARVVRSGASGAPGDGGQRVLAAEFEIPDGLELRVGDRADIEF